MPPLLTRRHLLAGAALGAVARPAISRAADRPALSHGLQSGDVSGESAVVWARADRPARAVIEWATTESFSEIRGGVFVDALPESDLTVKAALPGLPPDQEIFYRVHLQNLAEPALRGAPLVGRFRSAPALPRDVSFCWSGDTVGQGWGIDADRGGMTIYAAILGNRPDFFLHSGDTIYADGPLQAEVKLPDGSLWRNLVTEEKAKSAETLQEFRGNYKYNLLDHNLRAMNAAVPILAQWDDHEVTNNWWPGEPLTRPEHRRKGYAEANSLVLAARATRAFHEYMPMRFEPAEPGRVYRKIAYGPLLDVFLLDMRSYRGPNGANDETEAGARTQFLGPAQVAWLKRELTQSRATWKAIAADMPLGLVVPYDAETKSG